MEAVQEYTIEEKLTEAEQFLIDWQYQRPVGSFRQALIKTLTTADDYNLSRLFKAYPEEVRAIRQLRCVPGYWVAIQEKAQRLGVLS